MMPAKLSLSFIVSLVLFIAATPALADEIHLTATGGIGSFAVSSYQNGGGIYMATYPDSFKLQTLCCAVGDLQGENQGFLDFPAFSLPAGDKVYSAKTTLQFPWLLQYSYKPEVTQIFPAPDPNQRSVPGQIRATVRTTTTAELVDTGCFFRSSLTGADLTACNPDWSALSFFFDSITTIYPSVISTGFNSAEVFDVEGENAGPITGNIDIVYGPATPEPGSFILLGTGMMILLSGIALRRRARTTAGSMPMAN
jgi:hypothetical protein